MPLTSDFDRYLISVNEPIDKLVVNRPFSRIYDDISKIDAYGRGLSVSKATSANYGIVKFSSASGYYSTPPATGLSADCANYYGNVMGVRQLRDFVDSISRESEISTYHTSAGGAHESISAWIDLKVGDVSFVGMPNGNMMVIGDFDISLNNVPVTFKTDSVLSGDIEYPVGVSGFSTTIDADEDLLLLNDYAAEMDEIVGGDSGIGGLSAFVGNSISADYVSPLSATLKHNRCNWTTHSSYSQSYVEVVYSMTVDLSSLSKRFYDYSAFSAYRDGGSETKAVTGEIGDNAQTFVFTQKPMIVPQLAFYNNESRIRPYAKFCTMANRGGIDEDYFDDVYFDESPLSETEVLDNMISAVNGHVVVKGYENLYAKNGTVADNVITLDVSMRFFVGSAADPHLIDGMADLNAKAKVQLLMIGI